MNDLDCCMLVEAGAGSGKTASLVERMIALIQEGKCSISTIAAVTFTRKAAAEMKERLHIKLEERTAGEEDAEKKERLRRALQDIDSCYIGTIHAFCGRLLRERPVEAGLDPDFQEMDDMEDELLQKRVWDDYLLDLQVRNPQEIEALSRVDLKVKDLWNLFRNMSMYPEVVAVCQEIDPPAITDDVRTELTELLRVFEKDCPPAVPAGGWDDLQDLLHRVKRRWSLLEKSYLDGEQFRLEFLKLIEVMERSPEPTLKCWGDNRKKETREKVEEVKNKLEEFQASYVIPLLKQWREHRYSLAIKFVLPAVKYCQQYRFESGRLNYQDLLVKAVELLKIKEVREYFQKRYTHILVDEFQDTDPLQAELLFYLAGTETSETDWRKLTPRPGSLFIVGDPKQSIYRFRRADVTTYNEVKNLLLQAGGKVVSLTSNFRSVREIGEWVNQVFSKLLPEKASEVQAAYNRMDTVRACEDGDTGGVRKMLLPKVDRNTPAKIAEIDAEQIARWIRYALDSGKVTLTRSEDKIMEGLDGRPRPGDFMIILRSKSNMHLYTRALERYGIPYQVSGGQGFSESAEVSELIRLWHAVLDPDDPVKLLAVLRGPLFGFSDRQLLNYRRAGGVFDFRKDLPSGLMETDARMFAKAFTDLRRYQDYFKAMPVSAALERIIQESGLLAWTAEGGLGHSRAGFLLQACELVAARERTGMTSPVQLLEYLELQRKEGVEEDMALLPGGSDAVRLMNLHKAKGLEAPVVFLAYAHKRNRHRPSVHIRRQGNRPEGYFLVEGSYRNMVLAQPLDWQDYEARENEYEDAEEKRLLYVAATRACNLLVISYYPHGTDTGPWAELIENAEGLSELPVEDEEPAAEDTIGLKDVDRTENNLVLDEESWNQAQIRFMSPSSELLNPTYIRTTVTMMVKSPCQGDGSPDTVDRPCQGASYYDTASTSSENAAADTAARKGKEWGRVIHKVMAALTVNRGADLELLAENALAEEGRPLEEKDDAVRLVQGIMQSEVWQRMLQSSRFYVEVPMMVCTENESAGSTDAGVTAQKKVISAAIDLIFKEEDGWVIADYKTDAVDLSNEPGRARFERLIEYYAPQVRLYKQFWEKLTGERVKEAGLYFTLAGKWVEC